MFSQPEVCRVFENTTNASRLTAICANYFMLDYSTAARGAACVSHAFRTSALPCLLVARNGHRAATFAKTTERGGNDCQSLPSRSRCTYVCRLRGNKRTSCSHHAAHHSSSIITAAPSFVDHWQTTPCEKRSFVTEDLRDRLISMKCRCYGG